MALFGKADKDLPLLTKLYQADEVELEAFFAGEDVDQAEAAWCHQATKELLDSYTSESGNIHALLLDEIVTRWNNVSRLCLAVMPQPRMVDQTIFVNLIESPPEPDLMLPVRRVELLPDPDFSPVVYLLLQEMIDLVRGELKAARCVECKNPFIVRRGEPDYCSHRCRNRERQRNRYREKKSENG